MNIEFTKKNFLSTKKIFFIFLLTVYSGGAINSIVAELISGLLSGSP